MNAILYEPKSQPRPIVLVNTHTLTLQNSLAGVTARVPEILGCLPELVDVLATGPDYVAYSVFDYEGGPVNATAMHELTLLTGVAFEQTNEDAVLFGPVLVIRW